MGHTLEGWYVPTHIRHFVNAGSAVLAVLAAGCGENGGGEATPPCSSVWQDGSTLPSDYDGCMDGDTFEVLITRDCADGSKLTTFQDRFYAVLGGTIHESEGEQADDAGYARAWHECSW